MSAQNQSVESMYNCNRDKVLTVSLNIGTIYTKLVTK